MSHPRDDLTAYLDGALPPPRRAEVEAHLGGCAACRAERDRLAAAIALLGQLPPAPVPSPGFEQRFHARLAAERATARRPLLARLAWRWLAPGLAGAAAAAGVVLWTGARHRAHDREAFLAQHLELFEDYEAVAGAELVEDAEDVQVVAHLDELRGRP